MSFLHGLKIFTVHVKPGAVNPYEQPVFVREGFNVAAFLFTFIWALYKRLWIPAGLIFAANIGLLMMDEHHVISSTGVTVLQFGLQIIIGFHANDWLRAKMARRGYILADIVTGDNLLRAEQRYFERYLAAA